MRAHEFINELRTERTDKNFDQYVQDLIDQKAGMLGKGEYATVFRHPTNSNMAIKIFKEDWGYARYLHWCVSYPNNKYIPKFYPIEGNEYIKIYRSGDFREDSYQRYAVVLTELLSPLPEGYGTYYEFVDYLFKFITDPNKDKLLSKSTMKDHLYLNYFPASYWREISMKSARVDPDLSKLAALLKSYEDKYGGMDIGAHNFLWRDSTNNIVLTDPLSLPRRVYNESLRIHY
jgi:hypothetical protein